MLEQNPPDRIFLMCIEKFSQEDFAQKSTLRTCNFLAVQDSSISDIVGPLVGPLDPTNNF